MKKKALVILLLVVMLVGTFATFSYGADKKTGLYKEDGQWKYFENGTFKAATGLVQRPDNKTWHYVENGIYKKATGLVQCVQPGSSKGKWYYVVKGDLDNTAKGLVQCVQPGKSKGKWYYVNNGKLVNTADATGLVQCIQPGSSKGKWYYVRDGKLFNGFTGMAKCIQPNSTSKGKWYFVNKGKKENATGFIDMNLFAHPYSPVQDTDKFEWYRNEIWYIKDGKMMRDFSGTANIDGRTYSVKKGRFQKGKWDQYVTIDESILKYGKEIPEGWVFYEIDRTYNDSTYPTSDSPDFAYAPTIAVYPEMDNLANKYILTSNAPAIYVGGMPSGEWKVSKDGRFKIKSNIYKFSDIGYTFKGKTFDEVIKVK